MKKVTILSSLFVVAFGLALGMTVMFNTPAKADPQCADICLGYYECTYETGPACTAPKMPYYKYWQPTCSGGPYNCNGLRVLAGCCSHPDPI